MDDLEIGLLDLVRTAKQSRAIFTSVYIPIEEFTNAIEDALLSEFGFVLSPEFEDFTDGTLGIYFPYYDDDRITTDTWVAAYAHFEAVTGISQDDSENPRDLAKLLTEYCLGASLAGYVLKLEDRDGAAFAVLLLYPGELETKVLPRLDAKPNVIIHIP